MNTRKCTFRKKFENLNFCHCADEQTVGSNGKQADTVHYNFINLLNSFTISTYFLKPMICELLMYKKAK